MSDPLQPVNAGEISPLIGSARTVNAVLEAARRFRECERGGAGQSPALDPISAACVVFVRNDTGATLSEFSVVKLGEPIISASDAPFAFQSQPIFPATAPSAETDAFAVLQEPLAADGIGRAVVLGVAVVNVDFTSASHEYAKPGASTAALDSAAVGPAKVIWRAGSSGTQRCAVLLSGAVGDVVDSTAGVTADNGIAIWSGTVGRYLGGSLATVDAAGYVSATGYFLGTSPSYLLQASDGTNAWCHTISGGGISAAADGKFATGELRVNTHITAASYKTVSGSTGASATTGGLTFVQGLYTGGTFSGGTGTVTSVGLNAPAAGITVSGSPITASGAFTLTLADDLAAIEGLSGVGIAKRTGLNTWILGGIVTSDIDDKAVTLAKFEDITATRLLGRAAGTDGVMQEIELGAGFSFTGTTLNYTGTISPAGSDKQVQYNDGGALGAEAGFEYDKTADTFTAPHATTTKSITASGVITATVSATESNWNPSGLADASSIHITASGGNRTIRGIVAQSNGRRLWLRNVGTSNTITLTANDAGSSTANQFGFSDHVFLSPGDSVGVQYDTALEKWLPIGSRTSVTPLRNGGTGADLSLTGGTGQYLKQSTAGGVVTVGAIAASDIPTMVAAGPSGASGGVPTPGTTARNNRPYILGANAAWRKFTGEVLGSNSFDFGGSTLETTTSTSLAALATAQEITFTLDETSDVTVFASCTCRNSGAGNNCQIGIDYGGGTIINRTTCTTANVAFNLAGEIELSGLTAGTYTIRIRFAVSAGTGTFFARTIKVIRGDS